MNIEQEQVNDGEGIYVLLLKVLPFEGIAQEGM
jgi:hypothetical protein